MLQNVLSFFTKNLTYFQVALGAWQILKSTLPGVFIQGVMGWLLSLALPGVFPAYKQLRPCPGCLCKTVKCVVLNKGMSQSKTKRLTTIMMSQEANLISNDTSKPQHTDLISNATSKRQDTDLISNATSKSPPESMSVKYLGKPFEVKREGDKVYVNGEMSYYISDGLQWKKILQMEKKCFKRKDGKGSEEENKVVFVKGCRFIWQKVATGEVMEFGEVLDDFIFENIDTLFISNNVWFLPVDLSEKLEGKLPKLLNLVGLFFSTHKKPPFSLLANFFSIASAILEFSKLRSRIDRIINKMFCRSVQNICNKLPYSVRKCVYLLFISVENLKPRNDIQLKVGRRYSLNVFIGGAAKTSIPPEATPEEWLKKKEYEFRCGCSIVIKATYDDKSRKCKATVQHTNAVFGAEERLFVKCQSRREFERIGTFLSCLATSKAGSLFKYDRNDNKVHVRGWRESLRHYKEAGFPEIYKLTLHDVIV